MAGQEFVEHFNTRNGPVVVMAVPFRGVFVSLMVALSHDRNELEKAQTNVSRQLLARYFYSCEFGIPGQLNLQCGVRGMSNPCAC